MNNQTTTGKAVDGGITGHAESEASLSATLLRKEPDSFKELGARNRERYRRANVYTPSARITTITEIASETESSPTQASFNEIVDYSRNLRSSPIAHPSDSLVENRQLEEIMSRIDDAFDIQEWNQHEEQKDIGDSPETLTVTPQPVTYTTAGTLKPIINPQFAPPNRIQREGTLRRVTPAPVQTRGHDSYLSGRATIQQYNMGHGSSGQAQYGPSSQPHYGPTNQSQAGPSAQPQYGSSSHSKASPSTQSPYGPSTQSPYGSSSHSQVGPSTQSLYGPSSHSQAGPSTQSPYGPSSHSQTGPSTQSLFGSASSPQSIALNDLERKVLRNLGLPDPAFMPSMRSGNMPPSSSAIMPPTDPSLNPKEEHFNTQSQQKGDKPGQSTTTNNSMHKIDKMQTLLSISQYPNPMQQHAKDRLSGFAAAKVQNVAESTVLPVAQNSVSFNETQYNQTFSGTNMQSGTGYEKHREGGPDQNIHFLPPGLSRPPQAKVSASGYGQNTAPVFTSPNDSIFANQQHQMYSGRPQPLAAGPPGLRQNTIVNTQGMNHLQSTELGSSQSPYGQQSLVLPQDSPWLPNHRNNAFTSVPTEHSKIRNTLPLSEVAKYYPNGFPDDMKSGEFTRLPAVEHQKNIGMISQPGMTEEDISRKEQDKWWYSGVRQFNKTTEESFAELEKSDYERKHGLNPQPPASPRPISDYEKLSIKDIVAMSEPDVAEPIIGAGFGSLLRSAAQPNNLGTLNRFAPAPAWAIDNSENGNQSFFSDGWAQAPKRLGRDSRYQPFE